MPPGSRAVRVAGSLLLAAALLAACTERGEPLATTTTAAPRGAVVDGGTVRLGLGAPAQPDPVRANLGSPTDLLVLDLLHDGLTRVDDAGVPAAALATTWTPDATARTWEFELDPQATFASGRRVTAADVVASLERVARGGDASLAALRLEAVSGFRAFVDGTAEHLAGLSAPDAATVRIALDAPMSVLPVLLASPLYGVVDVESLDEAASDGGSLDGLDLSGGWSVATADERVTRLERRDGTDGHLDAVELHVYRDSEAAYEAFDSGGVDWALVPADRYDDAVADHGDEHFAPFHAELFFGMHVTGPALANGQLRKAIVAAIDRDAIVREVYPGLAEPLATIVPKGVPGHDADGCAGCGYDPERARSLVVGAFPDGQVPTVAIDFDQSVAQEAMARLVAGDLEAVGIPSTLRPKGLEEYKRFVVSGSQELFSFGWIGGYASADAYLAPLFGSAANDNLTAIASVEVDAALAAARASTDPAAAAAQWAAAEARVLATAVVVPIAQFRTQAVVADRVAALEHRVDGTVDWSEVWVTDGA